jgi:hypothetical protein
LTEERLTSNAGDIISINTMGQTVVVLNSLEIAKDLLEKRGTIYSDRPWIPVVEMCVQ